MGMHKNHPLAIMMAIAFPRARETSYQTRKEAASHLRRFGYVEVNGGKLYHVSATRYYTGKLPESFWVQMYGNRDNVPITAVEALCLIQSNYLRGSEVWEEVSTKDLISSDLTAGALDEILSRMPTLPEAGSFKDLN